MKSKNLCLPLISVVLLAAGRASAVAQANVVENQTVLLYVSATDGSNGNPGTEAKPLQTVGAAVDKANFYAGKNIGVKIEVEPGTYHEYVHIGWTRYNPTLTLEATQIGAAVIDAADPVTGWTPAAGNSAAYVHAVASLGANPVPAYWPATLAPVLYRREMVFVNNRRYEQVMAAANMVPGTFYVDDVHHLLYVSPLPGTSMQTAQVEISARPYTLQTFSRSNLVLRGLVFEHAATYMNQESAMVNSGSNVLVDRIEAHDNNWGGFGLHNVTNATLQNSLSHENGALGFMTVHSRSVLAQNVEADYNNWRGEQAGFYDFGMGGYKFFTTHGATVNGLYAYNNGAEGLWFDTDNRQITVENSTLEGNYDTNLQVELNVGPITIENTSLCYGTIGANLVNSENVTFANDTFYGNSEPTNTYIKPQFYLAGAPGGRHFVDWETGQYENVISQNITFSGNHFMDVGLTQKLFYTYLGGPDLATFRSSFISKGNSWFDGSQQGAFGIAGKWFTLAQWNSEMGADADATSAPVGAPRPCYDSQYPNPDFQIFIPTNQEWAALRATNGTATIPVYVKNFATGAPVTVRVLSQPGISLQASASSLAGSMPGQYAGGITNFVVSSSQRGTQFVTLEATSAGHVHSLTVPVTF
jgi:hypothetical protein